MYFEVRAIHRKSIDRNVLGLYIYHDSNWGTIKKSYGDVIFLFMSAAMQSTFFKYFIKSSISKYYSAILMYWCTDSNQWIINFL